MRWLNHRMAAKWLLQVPMNITLRALVEVFC